MFVLKKSGHFLKVDGKVDYVESGTKPSSGKTLLWWRMNRKNPVRTLTGFRYKAITPVEGNDMAITRSVRKEKDNSKKLQTNDQGQRATPFLHKRKWTWHAGVENRLLDPQDGLTCDVAKVQVKAIFLISALVLGDSKARRLFQVFLLRDDSHNEHNASEATYHHKSENRRKHNMAIALW